MQRARGHTLSELLLACAIGLVVTGALLVDIASLHRTQRMQRAWADLQEHERLAFALLDQALRSACALRVRDGGLLLRQRHRCGLPGASGGAHWWVANGALLCRAADGGDRQPARALLGASPVALHDLRLRFGVELRGKPVRRQLVAPDALDALGATARVRSVEIGLRFVAPGLPPTEWQRVFAWSPQPGDCG